jgi:hypothetical protein
MISFAEALAQTEACRRYLLLGNGFSISLFPNCFTYASLFQEAKDQGLLAKAPPLEAAFEALGTIDFEVVMEALKAAVKLSGVYGSEPAATKKMAEHAELLKDILVEAIAGRHPSRPGEVTEEQYENCRAFLALFIGLDRGRNHAGKIFSLNYDLLLYWAVLHDVFHIDWSRDPPVEQVDQTLDNDDGFRAPEDDYEAEYVAWEQFHASHGQTISYLHGAMHLFERGPELAKLCWERSGNRPLMDQIREALDDDRYPLFVSEGTSAFKLRRINKSAYLSKALRSFASCCDIKGGALFIIGHALAANDTHVLRRIKDGKIGQLYVSIFGDPDGRENRIAIAKARSFANARHEKLPLVVEFIDASTLHIWDH